MNIKWIAYFFVISLVFKLGSCFSSDNSVYDSSYRQSRLLYSDREEANRMQFKQMQLENEMQVRIINKNQGRQQIETNGVIWQERELTKNRYREDFLAEETKKAKMDKVLKQIDENEFLLELSNGVYEKEIILATISKFTNKCYIYLDETAGENFILQFKPKENKKEDLKLLIEDFCNELIDQQLRVDPEKEYGKSQNIIVKKAFSPIGD